VKERKGNRLTAWLTASSPVLTLRTRPDSEETRLISTASSADALSRARKLRTTVLVVSSCCSIAGMGGGGADMGSGRGAAGRAHAQRRSVAIAREGTPTGVGEGSQIAPQCKPRKQRELCAQACRHADHRALEADCTA
jgi:hypothetical protein